MALPLEGIKVVEVAMAVLSPHTGAHLSDMGAEVIKVEVPVGGESGRYIPPYTEGGECYSFIISNRGKKSITLDLESKRGHEITQELVKKSDILVENFHYSVLDKLGLKYEMLECASPEFDLDAMAEITYSPELNKKSADWFYELMGIK